MQLLLHFGNCDCGGGEYTPPEVAAAVGGAETVSVDLEKAWLDRIPASLAENGLDGEEGWFGGEFASFNKRRSTFTIKYDNGDRENGITLPDDTIRVQFGFGSHRFLFTVAPSWQDALGPAWPRWKKWWTGRRRRPDE